LLFERSGLGPALPFTAEVDIEPLAAIHESKPEARSPRRAPAHDRTLPGARHQHPSPLGEARVATSSTRAAGDELNLLGTARSLTPNSRMRRHAIDVDGRRRGNIAEHAAHPLDIEAKACPGSVPETYAAEFARMRERSTPRRSANSRASM
jgi:hypothetical protein